MPEMAERYNTVLVVGGEGEKCRIVAEGYGFREVVTPGDIIKDNQDTTPFRKLTEAENEHSRARNFNEVEIEAIFVFADSRDWAGDQQIILDLLMSKHGRLGTRSKTFEEGPPIFFSHNDVVWSTSHELTRIGMGALRASLEAMFRAVTGKEIKTTAYGKPQIGTFQFATRLLQQWRKDTHGIDSPPETVYVLRLYQSFRGMFANSCQDTLLAILPNLISVERMSTTSPRYRRIPGIQSWFEPACIRTEASLNTPQWLP